MTASGARRRLLGPVLAALLAATGLCHAMWARMTDAELQQHSALVVEGEWLGQGAWPGRADGRQLGAIAVSAALAGKAEPGSLVFVARPPAGRPIADTDLSFRRGDRGLWFLKRAPGGDEAYLVDHPQRFLRDSPENAAAIRAWRERLKR